MRDTDPTINQSTGTGNTVEVASAPIKPHGPIRRLADRVMQRNVAVDSNGNGMTDPTSAELINQASDQEATYKYPPEPVEVDVNLTDIGKTAVDQDSIRLTPAEIFPDIDRITRDHIALEQKEDARVWLDQVPGISEAEKDEFALAIADKGQMDNGGALKMTIYLGNIINEGQPRSRFSKTSKNDSGVENHETVPLSRDDYDFLIETAPNEGLHAYAKLAKSAAYPYEDLPEGAIVLPARNPEDARKVIIHGDQPVPKSVLCGRAEGLFANELYKLKSLYVGDKLVAVQKELGEDTALLVQDAVLNGVAIPAGSIMTVGVDEDGEPLFSFGRLSAFSISSPSEIQSAAPYLTGEYNLRTYATKGKRLNLIREKLGLEGFDVSRKSMNSYLLQVDRSLEGDAAARSIYKTLDTSYAKLANREEFYEEVGRLQDSQRIRAKKIKSEHEKSKPVRGKDSDTYMQELGTYYKKLDDKYDALDRELNIAGKVDSVANPRKYFEKAINTLVRTYGIDKVNQVREMRRNARHIRQILENLE